MLARRSVKRHGDAVRVRLVAGEERFIAQVVQTVMELVEDVDAEQPLDDIQARLLPRAYDDPLEQLEYADTMMGQMVRGKLEALRQVQDSLRAGQTSRGAWTVDLDADTASAWLAVVNDGRLVLGKLAGITTEADWDTLDREAADAAALLGYLGWLQESLVTLLMP